MGRRPAMRSPVFGCLRRTGCILNYYAIVSGTGTGKFLESVLEKVLIVEDEVHARSGLTELIESWGYRAECAADGMEGIEKASAWAPAIVVTDLKMPRMDGMELLDRIGQLPQRIAVVMLTAQGSIESAVDAMRSGAYDYIPKPVDPIRLKTILHNASRQREADV